MNAMRRLQCSYLVRMPWFYNSPRSLRVMSSVGSVFYCDYITNRRTCQSICRYVYLCPLKHAHV
jgi:hypothetical protein